MDENGNKLSKQNHATAIDINNPKPTLLMAMTFLGFQLPHDIEAKTVSEIIAWGSQNWRIVQLPDSTKITAKFSNEAV